LKLAGEKVRWHRDRLGWTIDNLAEKAEVAKGTVLRAEHGEDIRPSSGRRIARALGTEIPKLVPESPGTPSPKVLALSSPLVRDWLRERDARFALMDQEGTFRDYVLSRPLDLNLEGKPEGIARLIREIEAENDAVVEALRTEPNRAGGLFPKIRRDTPEDEIRDTLQASWSLERELESLYNRLRRIVTVYSQELFWTGRTGDLLAENPRQAEEIREQVLERAYTEVQGA
jgi:transcriptional regulator with XRE-family HTH domain